MSSPYLGEIRLLPWDWAPRGWALCAGQQLSIQQNAALFSLLGTFYGGNGVTTFALPDLRGRVPVHQSSQYPIGTQTGTETVTLLTTQMPAHTHLMGATTATANSFLASNNIYAVDTSMGADFYAAPGAFTTLQPGSVGNDGGSQPHNNMQPYLVMSYVIALQGIFPSRN